MAPLLPRGPAVASRPLTRARVSAPCARARARARARACVRARTKTARTKKTGTQTARTKPARPKQLEQNSWNKIAGCLGSYRRHHIFYMYMYICTYSRSFRVWALTGLGINGAWNIWGIIFQAPFIPSPVKGHINVYRASM